MSEDLSIVRYEELPPKDSFRRQKVGFTLGTRSKKVSGILRLVQLVSKLLLTTPGTDAFRPDLGTVIPLLAKRGVSAASINVIKTDITISLQDLERQIVDLQATEPIPDDERLQEIVIRNVEFVSNISEWIIDLSVLSQAGTEVAFDIGPFLKGQ